MCLSWNGWLQNPAAKGLYVFPTKALAQDQLRGLVRYMELDPLLPITPGTYDR